MEEFAVYKQKAIQNVKVADHMLTVTYPMMKDPKLLLAVLENLFMASTNAMACVLYYERLFKRVPPFADTFESKFTLFKQKIVLSYQVDLRWVRYIAELKELMHDHKESTTEFERKGRFVMADNDYRLKTLGEEDLKYYLKLTKEFVDYILHLVSKNDAKFGRR